MIRSTPQQRAILEYLQGSRAHPAADMIYEHVRQDLPKVSMGTIYRNLENLVRDGHITKLDMPGAQKRYDGDLRAHHHVRCDLCGTIADLFATEPTQLAKTAESETGFTIHGCQILFSGLCSSCQKQSAEA
ncbi:MAG: transcriptional repressor [Myxococcales bacterium]|nr:transcriptional repressor [Myxococcales bacterium]